MHVDVYGECRRIGEKMFASDILWKKCSCQEMGSTSLGAMLGKHLCVFFTIACPGISINNQILGPVHAEHSSSSMFGVNYLGSGWQRASVHTRHSMIVHWVPKISHETVVVCSLRL